MNSKTITGSAVPDGITLIPVRAADADRERAVQHLNDMHAQGRFDVDELERRRTYALVAVSLSDLNVLFSDLPAHQSVIPNPLVGGRRSRVAPVTDQLMTKGLVSATAMFAAAILGVLTLLLPIIGLANGRIGMMDAMGIAMAATFGFAELIAVICWAAKVYP